MSEKWPVIIIGGGQAAVSFAEKYRQYDDTKQPILMLSEESVLPYRRPPLSKHYLQGTMPLEKLYFHEAAWYEDNQVTIRLSTSVTQIDPEQCSVHTAEGKTYQYENLILATGARVRELPLTDDLNQQGLLVLRTLKDADRIKPHLVAGNHLLVIGGGYIGLEAAAVAQDAGMRVTVVELKDRVLERVAAADTSDYFQRLHERRGVQFRVSTSLNTITDSEGGYRVELDGAETVHADAILIGVGALPNDALAQAAGLSCQNGICVDTHCRTSDASIYAIGDCASIAHKSRWHRFESVPNANAMADIAAKNVAGQAATYQPDPWFWSDQYDVKLQSAGSHLDYDATYARQGAKEGAFSLWYYCGEELIAVDAINDPISYALGKKMIAAGISPDPAQLSDVDTPLKDIMIAASSGG